MSGECCGTCRWWDETFTRETPSGPMVRGDCRRHAPVVLQHGQRAVTRWPSTRKDAVCGSWKPKGEQAVAA